MSTRELVLRWLVAFVITQGVECPIYVRVFRVPLGTAFAASTITHPIVCFVIPALWRALYLHLITADPSRVLSADAYALGYGAIAESFAIVAESLWVWRMTDLGPRRAFVASLGANVASAATGALVSFVTGWP